MRYDAQAQQPFVVGDMLSNSVRIHSEGAICTVQSTTGASIVAKFSQLRYNAVALASKGALQEVMSRLL
jgi:hypothetical protein